MLLKNRKTRFYNPIWRCWWIFIFTVTSSLAPGVAPIPAAHAEDNQGQGEPAVTDQSTQAVAGLTCDPQIYYGVQHCQDEGSKVHTLLVNIKDPHVRVEPVLPLNPATGAECNSVRPANQDPASNCGLPYPFETVNAMLQRYALAGAVAVINADYFGCGPQLPSYPCGLPQGAYGAEGLVVKNGVRLDGHTRGVPTTYAYTAPSLAFSAAREVTIGIPGSQAEIDDNLTGRYYNAVGGSPLIIQNGQKIADPCGQPHHPYGQTCADYAYAGANVLAHSAAGIASNGHTLVLLTASKDAEGLADYLATNAAFLTGGSSIATALKFEGGPAASLAWLDSNGTAQSYSPIGQTLPVGVGLAIFSARITSQPAGMAPERLSLSLRPGVTHAAPISVTTGSTPIDKGDVAFVFDLTYSMKAEIGQAKLSAQQIMKTVVTQMPNTWFGVASFMDYPGTYTYPDYESQQYGVADDVPWQLNLQPTSDIPTVDNTIKALKLGDGKDLPEDYTRMLYELRNIQWRANAKKIIVVYGDAPTHDQNFAGFNNGGDPGVDRVAGTADDLDFEDVMQQVRASGVAVIAVNSAPEYDEAVATMKAMSIGYDTVAGTNGQYFDLAATSQLPAVTTQLILNETVLIDQLSLRVTEGFEDWIQVTPTQYFNVSSNTTKRFDVKITPPVGTTPGFYPFALQAIGDGVILGVTFVDVRVPTDTPVTGLGFLPNKDGYPRRDVVANPSWAMFRQFFGTNQVEYRNGSRIHAADAFFQQYYARAGAAGSSEGLVTTAMINYLRLAQPNAGSYAMPPTVDLFTSVTAASADQFNGAIQYAQGIPLGLEVSYAKAALCRAVQNSPKLMYDYVKARLMSNTPTVITVHSPDQPPATGKLVRGGHALLPYRYEETPGQPTYLYVYDPSYPGDNNRRIAFAELTGAGRWQYQLGTASQPGPLLTGDATACNLYATSLALYLHRGVPWWKVAPNWPPNTADISNTVRSSDLLRAMSTPPAGQLFAVSGPVQLLIMNDAGQRLGFTDSNFYDEIPGATYLPLAQSAAPGGLYYVPLGAGYSVRLQGVETGEATIGVFGDEYLAQLTIHDIAAATVATLAVTPTGDQIAVTGVQSSFDGALAINHLLADVDRNAQFGNLYWNPGDEIRLLYNPDGAATGDDLIQLQNTSNSPQATALTLQQTGEAGYESFGAALDTQAVVTVTLDSWSTLDQVPVQVKNHDGNEQTQILSNQAALQTIAFETPRTIMRSSDPPLTLTIALRDQFGAYIADGTRVELSTDLGVLSSTVLTTTGGLAQVAFDPNKQWGKATITAQASDVTNTVQITVTAPSALPETAEPLLFSPQIFLPALFRP